MSKVVIFGIGQIAEIAYFYLKNDSSHEVVGFTVDAEYIETGKFHGLGVVAYEELEAIYPPDIYKLFMPISYKGVNEFRKAKFINAKQRGYEFISYISSKARYYGTPVGENCFIFEDNVIQPFTEIGDNCILWSGNHIGHHTKIEDHVFIASHVVVSGSVEIGSCSFLGVNATVRDNIKIGKSNVIGASATILSNTDDYDVYASSKTDKYRKRSDELKGI